MNFVTALAYHFCLALPAAFTQPGNYLLAEPCPVHTVYTAHDAGGGGLGWRKLRLQPAADPIWEQLGRRDGPLGLEAAEAVEAAIVGVGGGVERGGRTGVRHVVVQGRLRGGNSS